MPAILVVRACSVPLCFGVLSWTYLLCLPFMGAEDAFVRNFFLLWGLFLVALAALLTICIGIVPLIYYALCYPTNGSKRPVMVRCGLYLLPASTFELYLLILLFVSGHPPA